MSDTEHMIRHSISSLAYRNGSRPVFAFSSSNRKLAAVTLLNVKPRLTFGMRFVPLADVRRGSGWTQLEGLLKTAGAVLGRMPERLVVLCLLGLGCCFAQADRAALTGTITDATHAPLPDAHIKVTYPNTGLSRETTTSNSGVFRLAELPIGACYVEVGATGFQPLKTTAVTLDVAQTRTLDLTLEVASSKSTVVTSVVDELQQNNATVGDVLTGPQLDYLPVNGRDWKSLMSLVPGAVNGNDFFSTGGDDINYRLDGTDASGIRDQNMKVYTRLSMSQDAVAEFGSTSNQRPDYVYGVSHDWILWRPAACWSVWEVKRWHSPPTLV
jgi:hypothetical protein